MSLRKIAALLAAGGLAVGLIGGGIGAQFTGQVSAQENLNVGTFGCEIASATAGVVSPDKSSVVYDAGTITSSVAASKPLSFTVKSTGSIPVVLNITATPVPSPFTDLLAPTTAVTLAEGGSQVYTAGISWPELTNADLGKTASVAYVVNCNEVGANPQTTISFSSVGHAKGVFLDDTITGAGFLPNKDLTVYFYEFGSPTPINLLDFAGIVNHTTGASGGLTSTFQENCQDGAGVTQTTDVPLIVWASDGTRSAIGSGIIVCSQF